MGVDPKATRKARELLILLNGKNVKKCQSRPQRYTRDTRKCGSSNSPVIYQNSVCGPQRPQRRTNFGLPSNRAGRLLHCPFRGLLSVHSRCGLHARQVAFATLCTRGFSSLVASTAAPIATRVERTSSRAGLPPLWTNSFSRRTGLPTARELARLRSNGPGAGYDRVRYMSEGLRMGDTR